MTPDRHEQIKRLFLAACELSENSRSAFLAQACAGDPQLRQEVESLLAHHHEDTIIAPTPVQNDRSTDSEVRFPPGTVLMNRYRIVTLLGRGSMGEVYRTDDLKLGQTVALKFLSSDLVDDPRWRERFYREARIARTITHVGICRIFDIGETGGEMFISMEYIDGETLFSLLNRIGRLSLDKAMQIARQLCAGLGAAHDRGILHRDLKPANIMIDGNGNVRITDFGIAVPIKRSGERIETAGTPGYIAPEIFKGAPPTVGSDIYALGLVLYEILTGDTSPASALDVQKAIQLSAPSAFVPEIDPQVDCVILQCLDKDPVNRPASVYDVAAALPGGDPLSEAIAEGRMPSPNIVAAGRLETVNPRTALASFVAVLIGLAGVMLLADRTFFWSLMNPPLSPAVLEQKAEQILQSLGYAPDLANHRCGFVVDLPGLTTLQTHAARRSSWRDILAGDLSSPLFFEYRQGESPTTLLGPLREPDPELQASLSSHEIVLRLSPLGRLLNYRTGPDVTPNGPAPSDHGRRLQARTDPRLEQSTGVKTRHLTFLIAIITSAYLAWRNTRSGRGDFQGARRLALFMFILETAGSILRDRPTTNFVGSSSELILVLKSAAFEALIAWLFYLALEPYVRRFWPRSIISWSRLLLGRWRDPWIGRDCVMGAVIGVAIVLIYQINVLLPHWISWPLSIPIIPEEMHGLVHWVGFRYLLALIALSLAKAIWVSLILLLLMLLSRMLVPVAPLATLAFLIVSVAVFTLSSDAMRAFPWLTSALVCMSLAFLLHRFGLVAAVASLFTVYLLANAPMTLNLRVWYISSTAVVLAVLIGMLALALRLTMASSRPRPRSEIHSAPHI